MLCLKFHYFKLIYKKKNFYFYNLKFQIFLYFNIHLEFKKRFNFFLYVY